MVSGEAAAAASADVHWEDRAVAAAATGAGGARERLQHAATAYGCRGASAAVAEACRGAAGGSCVQFVEGSGQVVAAVSAVSECSSECSERHKCSACSERSENSECSECSERISVSAVTCCIRVVGCLAFFILRFKTLNVM